MMRRGGRWRRRLLVALADIAVRQEQRSAWRSDPRALTVALVLWVVAGATPPRLALAWHRLRYRQARARRAVAPTFPAALVQELAHPPTLAVANGLSARGTGHQLALALQSLRRHGPLSEGVYRRAIARLARADDGQVEAHDHDPTAVAGAWGEIRQDGLREELAWWAVTRQAWRNDPSIRRLLTTASRRHPVGHAAGAGVRDPMPPIGRVLAVVQGGGALGISPRERALALCDACTWPEWLDTAGQSVLQDVLGGLSRVEVGRLALTADDLRVLLASPAPSARLWVLTMAIPQHPTVRTHRTEAATRPGTERVGNVRDTVD